LRTRLAILSCALAAFAAAQDTATVEGVVVNKVTGAGIGDVTVWLWNSGANSYKAVTNEAGLFQVTGLTPGDYSSRVEKNGYSSSQSGPLDPLADPPKHHISPGGEPVRLRFELIPPAILRGRVIGADGNPAKAAVEIDLQRRVNTNADGSFAFENLWPGPFTLLARPMTNPARLRDLMTRAVSVRVEPGSTASLQLRVIHLPD
jgi:protocatechuate 3,4-dioxygenase beta subunit